MLTDHGIEGSLASCGPEVPHDFMHNYELNERGFQPQAKREAVTACIAPPWP